MNNHNNKFNPDTDTILPGYTKRRLPDGQKGRHKAHDRHKAHKAQAADQRTAGRGAEAERTGQKMSKAGRMTGGPAGAGRDVKTRRGSGAVSGRTGSGSRKQRKKVSGAFKALALIFIVVIITASVFFIRSLGAGTKSDDKGMKAYKSGDYVLAEQFFSEAVGYDKTNAQYYVHLGMAQIKQAKFDEALATFGEAESRTHQKGEIQAARRGKGIAYLYKGDYNGAEEAFNSALASAGSRYTAQEIDILYYLAETQERGGDSVGAVLTYTKIIEQTGDADAYMLRGIAYQQVGDNTNAETDLYKALEMNEKNYKVYLSLYRVLADQGKDREAEKVLAEAAALTAKSGEDYTNQGLIYMYMGDYADADAVFETAVSGGYTAAYFGKAQNFMKQERYDEAISSFDLYFTDVTDDAIAYNEYGICLEKTGRYAEAAEAFAAGIALNDRTVDGALRFNEVNVLEKMGQWQAAYEKMQAYVEKYPDDAAAAKELIFLESRQK